MDLSAEDDVRSFLTRLSSDPRVGRVTIRLAGGSTLTGTIGPLGNHSVILKALSGREFYDAYIRLEAIACVEVQTRS